MLKDRPMRCVTFEAILLGIILLWSFADAVIETAGANEPVAAGNGKSLTGLSATQENATRETKPNLITGAAVKDDTPLDSKTNKLFSVVDSLAKKNLSEKRQHESQKGNRFPSVVVDPVQFLPNFPFFHSKDTKDRFANMHKTINSDKNEKKGGDIMKQAPFMFFYFAAKMHDMPMEGISKEGAGKPVAQGVNLNLGDITKMTTKQKINNFPFGNAEDLKGESFFDVPSFPSFIGDFFPELVPHRALKRSVFRHKRDDAKKETVQKQILNKAAEPKSVDAGTFLKEKPLALVQEKSPANVKKQAKDNKKRSKKTKSSKKSSKKRDKKKSAKKSKKSDNKKRSKSTKSTKSTKKNKNSKNSKLRQMTKSNKKSKSKKKSKDTKKMAKDATKAIKEPIGQRTMNTANKPADKAPVVPAIKANPLPQPAQQLHPINDPKSLQKQAPQAIDPTQHGKGKRMVPDGSQGKASQVNENIKKPALWELAESQLILGDEIDVAFDSIIRSLRSLHSRTPKKGPRRPAISSNILFLKVTLPTVIGIAILLGGCFYLLRVNGKVCTRLFEGPPILSSVPEEPATIEA